MAAAAPPPSSLFPNGADLPRVRGLASQLAATRSVVATWLPPGGGGTSSSSDKGDWGVSTASAEASDCASSEAHATAPADGGVSTGDGSSNATAGWGPLPSTPFLPLTADMAAAMPEYTLLGRSPRARAWLSELWDPAGGAPPVDPPIDPAALAGSVASEQITRYPAPVPTGPGEDTHAFGPADEADGSGLGPAVAVSTVMVVPVEAPPLARWWTAAAGGNALLLGANDTASAADVLATSRDEAYDEDDEVVTVRVVIDIQRDLLPTASLGLLLVPPFSRGVFHRRTGEWLTLMSTTSRTDARVGRLLMMEYTCPTANGGSATHFTTLGVDAGGRLGVFSRSSAVLAPSAAMPPPAFRPTDGVTAVATATHQSLGSFGLAYAPSVDGAELPTAAGGGTRELVSMIVTSGPASVATTFRMRRMAAAVLVPPGAPRAPPPPRVVSPGGGGGDGDGRGGQGRARRLRRRRVDLDAVPSAAARARIVRNREAAARCNAARKAARVAAAGAAPVREGERSAVGDRSAAGERAAAASLLPILPRPPRE